MCMIKPRVMVICVSVTTVYRVLPITIMYESVSDIRVYVDGSRTRMYSYPPSPDAARWRPHGSAPQ